VYIPPHFAQQDPATLHALMRERPLATLVVTTAAGVTADLLPLEFDSAAGPHGTLRGHVARANPLWRDALPDTPVLALFHGPQAYVTPSWYAEKQAHGRVVPTWNYTVVQASGPLHVVHDAPWLRELVGRLTDHHEAPRTEPWAVSDAPEAYVEQLLRAIVGIEIPLAALVGKWKVSQNRSAADRAGVIAGLAEGPAGDGLLLGSLIPPA
jgi:transcriptional regulator